MLTIITVTKVYTEPILSDKHGINFLFYLIKFEINIVCVYTHITKSYITFSRAIP